MEIRCPHCLERQTRKGGKKRKHKGSKGMEDATVREKTAAGKEMRAGVITPGLGEGALNNCITLQGKKRKKVA